MYEETVQDSMRRSISPIKICFRFSEDVQLVSKKEGFQEGKAAYTKVP
jgi:hypothetical protein